MKTLHEKRLAKALLLKYIELQNNKEFANIKVFSPERQIELNIFNEYMECVRNNQLKANGDGENNKNNLKPKALIKRINKFQKSYILLENSKNTSITLFR